MALSAFAKGSAEGNVRSSLLPATVNPTPATKLNPWKHYVSEGFLWPDAIAKL